MENSVHLFDAMTKYKETISLLHTSGRKVAQVASWTSLGCLLKKSYVASKGFVCPDFLSVYSSFNKQSKQIVKYPKGLKLLTNSQNKQRLKLTEAGHRSRGRGDHSCGRAATKDHCSGQSLSLSVCK